MKEERMRRLDFLQGRRFHRESLERLHLHSGLQDGRVQQREVLPMWHCRQEEEVGDGSGRRHVRSMKGPKETLEVGLCW